MQHTLSVPTGHAYPTSTRPDASTIADAGRKQPLLDAGDLATLAAPGTTHLPVARHHFEPTALARLSKEDRRLFEEFGQGPIVDLSHLRIHDAFEQHAAAAPDNVAARHLGAEITYGELDRRANQLAALLVARGVRAGDNVALFLERSIPMLVGILATLKAGAAYVPQHVGVAPEAQLRHVIDAADTDVILTLSHLRDQVPVPDGCTCLAIDEILTDVPADEMAQPLADVPRVDGGAGPDDRCFVLFTSGTTGNPNGVQVTHRNVCNILLTEPGDLGMRPGRTVSQLLSIAFDMAAWETLGALSHGATLIIRGRDLAAAARQANVIIATPSILATIDPAECPDVEVVAVAGEPCPRPLADRWAKVCRFHNSCGPTETTIVNTAQHYEPDTLRLTIGSPTPNNTVYVLDEHLRPCAIGEVGEMWAGGDGVTAGYLHNDELNADRYRPDPFLGGGRRMFRTRDLGRWTPDGELEHLGRTDDQVKVRGFRVELDSVSNALESTPGCSKAVTLKLDDRDLVAFVSPATVDVDAARAAVAAALPYYCVPAVVLAVDSLPITSRGKTDKRALLDLAHRHLAAEAVNELEVAS
ncbi:MAG: amino acid adenylation domain-containing protein [Actinomycetota bacterium]|nr:amino acid adenylation domain-containing protein [Actinomycetota bacterium]